MTSSLWFSDSHERQTPQNFTPYLDWNCEAMTTEIIVRRRTGVRLLESSRVKGGKRLPTHHTSRSPCTADFLLPQIKNESYIVKSDIAVCVKLFESSFESCLNKLSALLIIIVITLSLSLSLLLNNVGP